MAVVGLRAVLCAEDRREAVHLMHGHHVVVETVVVPAIEGALWGRARRVEVAGRGIIRLPVGDAALIAISIRIRRHWVAIRAHVLLLRMMESRKMRRGSAVIADVHRRIVC